MSVATMFGAPGEGIHTHVFGVAIVDVAMTAGAAVVIGRATNQSIPLVFIGLIGVGTAAHSYFGVNTVLGEMLGSNR